LGLHSREVGLKGVVSRQISIESVESLRIAIEDVRPDIFVHTIGLTNVDKCEENQEEAYHVNVELAENVALACRGKDIQMIHISTDHLFNGKSPMLTENEKVHPLNVYAKTKAIAEEKVLAANPDALVIRTNFFGWGHKYRTSFTDWIINSLRGNATINMYDDVYFTPILIDRLVEVCEDLAKKGCKGIFNVVGDERISKFEFANKVAECFDLPSYLVRKTSFEQAENTVRRPKDMSLNNARAREIFGSGLGNVAEFLDQLKIQEKSGRPRELFEAVS